MNNIPNLIEFPTNRGRTVWLDPGMVTSVQAIPTRYGAKLLVGVGEAEPSIWIEDRIETRQALGIVGVERIPTPLKISELAAAKAPEKRGRGRPRKKAA